DDFGEIIDVNSQRRVAKATRKTAEDSRLTRSQRRGIEISPPGSLVWGPTGGVYAPNQLGPYSGAKR
ncbi:MAG: hypothetical protein ACKN9S_08375, partial [Pirellula sp.]